MDYLSSKLSLTISINKVFTFLSILPVWEQRIPWQLSKQTSKIFFQMSTQVYSVHGQTEGRTKALLEWKSIDLCYGLSLTGGGNLTIIKVFIILFLLVRIRNILAIILVYSLFGQSKGERKAFSEECKKGGHIMRLPLRALGCHKR